MNQYDEKNMGIINTITMARIKKTRILIVGLGGIGAHLTNHLVRLGVQTVHLCDHDVYQRSNINRQLFSAEKMVGKSKVVVVTEALTGIRPDVEIIAHACKIEDINEKIWSQIDIVMDALDSSKMKIYLEMIAGEHRLPVVHGAIAGWYGQVGIIMPGTHIINRLYDGKDYGLDANLGSPTFTPAVIAAMMVGELVKFLDGDEKALINKILMVDLANNNLETLAFEDMHNKKENY